MSEKQAGFFENCGTINKIVNIRNIMKKCRNHNISIYLSVIDYANGILLLEQHATLGNPDKNRFVRANYKSCKEALQK